MPIYGEGIDRRKNSAQKNTSETQPRPGREGTTIRARGRGGRLKDSIGEAGNRSRSSSRYKAQRNWREERKR